MTLQDIPAVHPSRTQDNGREQKPSPSSILALPSPLSVEHVRDLRVFLGHGTAKFREALGLDEEARLDIALPAPAEERLRELVLARLG